MVQETAEEVVEFFEGSNKYRFDEVLEFFKERNHISANDFNDIRHQAEVILTYDLFEHERGVDVC